MAIDCADGRAEVRSKNDTSNTSPLVISLFIKLSLSVNLKPFKLRSFPLMSCTAATGRPASEYWHLTKQSFGIDGT
jgi:hypothetical protein